MSDGWKKWIVAACIALAAGPAIAQEKSAIIIDGTTWLGSTALERRAFLVQERAYTSPIWYTPGG
jgi:hypothetical protein